MVMFKIESYVGVLLLWSPICMYIGQYCLFWWKAYYAFYNINLLNMDTS